MREIETRTRGKRKERESRRGAEVNTDIVRASRCWGRDESLKFKVTGSIPFVAHKPHVPITYAHRTTNALAKIIRNCAASPGAQLSLTTRVPPPVRSIVYFLEKTTPADNCVQYILLSVFVLLMEKIDFLTITIPIQAATPLAEHRTCKGGQQ